MIIDKKIYSILLLLVFSTGVLAQEAPRRPPPERTPPNAPVPNEQRTANTPSPEEIENTLQTLISQNNLLPTDPNLLALPNIEDPKAQLGMQLFFTKNLAGTQTAACVSCHHPSLGGGDNLSLSVGVNAIDAQGSTAHALLGIGRFNNGTFPTIARNAPTIFNIGLYQRGLFWDSRIERSRNGAILTPESLVNNDGRRRPDNNIPADASLAAAQARFPVTSFEEMRGDFLANEDGQTLRSSLAQRFDNSFKAFQTTWNTAFSEVYGDNEVSFERIADAIATYERSMVFVNNPWNNYLKGEQDALSDAQKSGAVLFFTSPQQGGAGCVNCHNGSAFTNERHHLVAFPQIGVGKGNLSSTNTSQDFGRENVTGNRADRYHFRTPSLLNVSATAPYGHNGAYQSLTEVVLHYANPAESIARLFAAQNNIPFSHSDAPYCQIPQFESLAQNSLLNCEEIFPDSFANSLDIIHHLDLARENLVEARAPLRARPRLSTVDVANLVSFLSALTDPCVSNRACLAPWIIGQQEQAQFPDDQILIGHDRFGDLL